MTTTTDQRLVCEMCREDYRLSIATKFIFDCDIFLSKRSLSLVAEFLVLLGIAAVSVALLFHPFKSRWRQRGGHGVGGGRSPEEQGGGGETATKEDDDGTIWPSMVVATTILFVTPFAMYRIGKRFVHVNSKLIITDAVDAPPPRAAPAPASVSVESNDDDARTAADDDNGGGDLPSSTGAGADNV
jgi:hypothetical protein